MKFYLALLLAITPYFACAQKQGQPLIDSLLGELLRSKEDTNKVKLFDQLSTTYSNINPDEGLHLGQKAVDLSNKLSWEKGIAMAMADLGVNQEAKSDHAKALEYYNNALTRYERMEDKGNIAGIFAGIGLLYLAQSNYPKALEYDFKALGINETLGNRKRSAAVLENIGTVYFEQKEYAKTEEYYANALNICNDLGDKESVARNFGNVGIVLAAKGDYAEAIKQQLKALKIHQELGKINAIQINLTNIGTDYAELKEYPEAVEYLRQAIRISEKIGNKNNIAINLGNLGETYLRMALDAAFVIKENGKMANLRNAILYLNKAVGLCTETNFSGPLVAFSLDLSEAYSLSGDYKKSLESLKQSTATKDVLFSLQNKTQIASLEKKREDELKSKEMLIKDKQIRINELTISQKHGQQKLSIACIMLLLLVVGVVLKSLHDYRRSNYTLVKEKKRHLLLIEEQIGRLKNQTAVLKQISHMQAHGVRGPVATILGLVQMFNYEDFSDPSNKVVVESIATVTERLDTAVKEVIKKENDFDHGK